MTIIIQIVQPSGVDIELEANEQDTLLESCQRMGIDGLVGECGGNCACGTCHCYVDYAPPGALSAPSTEELQMLDFVACEREDNSRLACQIKITQALSGMRIIMPERQF